MTHPNAAAIQALRRRARFVSCSSPTSLAGVCAYADLAKRLTEMGLPETDSSIGMKINRGTFPAWFLFAVMRAVGARTPHLE